MAHALFRATRARGRLDYGAGDPRTVIT